MRVACSCCFNFALQAVAKRVVLSPSFPVSTPLSTKPSRVFFSLVLSRSCFLWLSLWHSFGPSLFLKHSVTNYVQDCDWAELQVCFLVYTDLYKYKHNVYLEWETEWYCWFMCSLWSATTSSFFFTAELLVSHLFVCSQVLLHKGEILPFTSLSWVLFFRNILPICQTEF